MDASQSSGGAGPSRQRVRTQIRRRRSSLFVDERHQGVLEEENRIGRASSTLALNRRHVDSNYVDLRGSEVVVDSVDLLNRASSVRTEKQQSPKASKEPYDTFTYLQYRFGFQRDSVDNQREHLALLLENTKRVRSEGEDDESHVYELHSKVFENYAQWCHYMGVQVMYSSSAILDIALYLLIWGEAANLRFCPECLCFVFHKLSERLEENDEEVANPGSFMKTIIRPLYDQLAKMRKFKTDGRLEDCSKIRNYDDFNEFFWNRQCLFFNEHDVVKLLDQKEEKTFKEKRSVFTLLLAYFRIAHFYVLWFHLLVALAYLAFISWQEIMPRGWDIYRAIWDIVGDDVFAVYMTSVLLTWSGSAYFACILDLWLTGSSVYQNISYVTLLFVRMGIHSVVFGCVLCIVVAPYAPLVGNSTLVDLCPYVIALYIIPQWLLSVARLCPKLQKRLGLDMCARDGRMGFVCGPQQSLKSVLRYGTFWVVLLFFKMWTSFELYICPLMGPSVGIFKMKSLEYVPYYPLAWQNLGLLIAFWLPAFLVYMYDVQIWFAIFEALVGVFKAMRLRLGNFITDRAIRKQMRAAPLLFDRKIVTRAARAALGSKFEGETLAQQCRLRFAVVWNECINSFRLGDLVDDREATVLQYEIRAGGGVHDPVSLSAGMVERAIRTTEHLARRAANDGQIRHRLDHYGVIGAVMSCYEAVKDVMLQLLENDDEVTKFFAYIEKHADEMSLSSALDLTRLREVTHLLSELLAVLLDLPEPDSLARVDGGAPVHGPEAVMAVMDRLTDLITAASQLVVSETISKGLASSGWLSRLEVESRLSTRISTLFHDRSFSKLLSRAFLLLTLDTVDALPRCVEARRRINFFLHSLSMDIPAVNSMMESHSFTVITPYYSEPVIYSLEELNTPLSATQNAVFKVVEEMGADPTVLQYLTTCYPDEWGNFLERLGEASANSAIENSPMEVRLWASHRGQTLARTVRGMMLYEDAIKILHWLEVGGDGNMTHEEKVASMDTLVRMKFSYITSCQVYGWQKTMGLQQADDIDFLMVKHPNWRVAYVDEIPEGNPDQSSPSCRYDAVLVRSDGREIVEVYRYNLPGNPILGEGKPENQNIAIPFSRGEFIQTIDMNQEHYFEETLKIASFLATADQLVDGQRPRIIGMREHIFTGSASSLSTFMAWQELVFVTTVQRVLADPLRARMHYGHPDFFDKLFAITRGGVSKASKGVNLSEDIFAGFNTTLRGGLVTHQEFTQCGKGRDVGMTQICKFEAKLANGSAEASMSRELQRLGTSLDFFRLSSVYFAHTGFYVTTVLVVLGIFAFIYGKVYMVLSGVLGQILDGVNGSEVIQLDALMNTQYIFQLGWLLTVPLLLTILAENGIVQAAVATFRLLVTFGPVFYAFQMGTRHHFYLRSLLHGGAMYRGTGRGFNIFRDQFIDIHMRYNRSHFQMGMELLGLVIIYLVWGYFGPSKASYGIAAFAVWFIAAVFLVSPFLFNSEGFEFKKTKKDLRLWGEWMFAAPPREALASAEGGLKEEGGGGGGGGGGGKGGDPSRESWQVWFEEDTAHFQAYPFWSRVCVLLKESRHFFVAYLLWVSSFAPAELTLLVASTAVVLVTLWLYGAGVHRRRLPLSVKLLLLVVVFIVLLVGAVVATSKAGYSGGLDAAAMILAELATLYGLLQYLVTLQTPRLRLASFVVVQEMAFVFDTLLGSLQAFLLFTLSAIPFTSILQARMMYNRGFTRAISGAHQYAIALVSATGLLAGTTCGWLTLLCTVGADNTGLAQAMAEEQSALDLSLVPVWALGLVCVGALLALPLMQWWGMRWTMLVGCLFALAGGIAGVAGGMSSDSGAILAWALSAAGVGVLYCATPLYNFDVATAPHKCKSVLTFLLGVAFGYFLYAVSYPDVSADTGLGDYGLQFILASIPAMLLIICLIYMVESPMVVYQRWGPDHCEAVLIRLRRQFDVDAELQAIADADLRRREDKNPRGKLGKLAVSVMFQIGFAFCGSIYVYYSALPDLGSLTRGGSAVLYMLGVSIAIALVDRVRRKTLLKDALPVVALLSIVAGILTLTLGPSSGVAMVAFGLLRLVSDTSLTAVCWVTSIEFFMPFRRTSLVALSLVSFFVTQACIFAAAPTVDVVFFVSAGLALVITACLFCFLASTEQGAICLLREKQERLERDCAELSMPGEFGMGSATASGDPTGIVSSGRLSHSRSVRIHSMADTFVETPLASSSPIGLANPISDVGGDRNNCSYAVLQTPDKSVELSLVKEHLD